MSILAAILLSNAIYSSAYSCVNRFDCDPVAGMTCVNSVCTYYASSLQNLTYYWPLTSQLLTDEISGAQLTNTYSLSDACTDHNNEYYGCFYLSYRYFVLPSAVYFNSDFTLSVWINPYLNSEAYTRILEFGNGKYSNNVILMVNGNDWQNFYPSFWVIPQESYQMTVTSSIKMSSSSWHFIAATFTSTQANIYLDGVLAGSTTYASFTPANVVRTRNYVGGSSWSGSVCKHNIDDIRIYNRALSAQDIQNLYLF